MILGARDAHALLLRKELPSLLDFIIFTKISVLFLSLVWELSLKFVLIFLPSVFLNRRSGVSELILL